MLRRLYSRDLGLAVGLAFLAMFAQQKGLLAFYENQFYDFSVSTFSKQYTHQDISIIAIDDKSLRTLGSWPWPRSIHAELINKLSEIKTKAIGYDVIFAEKAPANPKDDEKLLNATKHNKNIIFPVFPDLPSSSSLLSVTQPWPELAEQAQLAHVDLAIDNDSVLRSIFLYAGMNGKKWPALGLALFSHQVGLKNPTIATEPNQPANIWIREAHFYIPFGAAPQTVSFIDVLSNDRIRQQLQGKYVLVGMTATGLGQGFNTPENKHHQVSGSLIHASLLNALLTGSIISDLDPLSNSLLILILVVCPVCCALTIIQSAPLIAVGLGIVANLLISIVLLQYYHLRYDPIAALGGQLLCAFMFHQRSKQFIGQLLFSEKAKSYATLMSIADAVITTDSQGVVNYLNPAAEALTACQKNTAKGLHIDALLKLQSINGDSELIATEVISQQSIEPNPKPPYSLIDKVGREHIICISATAITGLGQHQPGTVLAIRDISETFKISQKMTYQATHDPLTGLPNRSLIKDRLGHAISSASRTGQFFAVLFVDLDGFKKINDGLGHTIGDKVLIVVATRLNSEIREIDSVARWGGDEFIILLTGLNNANLARRIAEKIRTSLQPPIYVDENQLFVTPSIGISIFPKDGKTAETLISRADSAMFNVKETGRNNICFFSEDLNQKASQRLILEKEMHHALAAGEFEIYYQPQIEMKTGQILSVEALIRWNHKTDGLVLPDTFIPIAEDTGLINPLGNWILDTACQQLKQWQALGLSKTIIAVNVSPRQFMQANFCKQIQGIINKHAVEPGLISFEITESLMIKDVERTCNILHELKRLGVMIAIDDFGTGYSSLSLLRRFPIDQLKIDKTFISQLTAHSHDDNIVKALISLAHNMDMQIVAEGIETEKQLQFLIDNQCDLGQGYYYYKPLTADQMTGLLSENHLPITTAQNKAIR